MKTSSALLLIAGAGLGVFILGAVTRPREVKDVQTDSQLGLHRGLGPTYGPEQTPTREPSKQDPQGGKADYLGYPYGKSRPSVYAKGEPAQHLGKSYDKREDDWAFVPPSPIDYGAPPIRIPKLWKDANRFWDGITSWGGVDAVGQRVHLFHLRPSYPTRGYRSLSGSLASVGGGMSTASRARIPAIFVPSAVA